MAPWDRLVLLALLLTGLSGCSLVRHELRHLTGSAETRLADDVVIERDRWGVPHVQGRSDAAVLFGLAYAMAEDNYWQMEEDMLHALGWASHYYGERELANDLARAAFDTEARARAEYQAEPAERRALWDAFTHGVNHYLQSHPEAPRRLLVRYEPWMLFARAAAFDTSVLTDTLSSAGSAAPGSSAGAEHGWGWAIRPAESATGEALLLTALDAPWFGTGQLYEAELRSDDGLRVAGAFQLGLPLLRAGHNERVAWQASAAGESAVRLTRLVFDHPTDSMLFRVNAGWERASSREDTLVVNTAEGVTGRAVRFTLTRYGAVVRRQADTAFAAQLAEYVQGGTLQLALELSRAASLDAFRAALAPAAAARWSALYADVDGTIAAWVAGAEQAAAADGGLQIGRPGPVPPAPDSGWSVAALERVAFDASVPDALPDIDALVHEWEMIGGTNPRRAFALDSAVSLLRDWDGRFSVESAAALLYALWQEEYARGNYGSGLHVRFLALETALARRARSAAAAETWGDLQRLQRRHTSGVQAFADSLPSLALGAAPAWTGAAFVVDSRRDLGWRRYAVRGRAWTAVTRLSQPPQASTVVPFGQSALAGSAHFEDQAPRFASGELKELQFGGPAESSAARERYHPGRRARVLQQ